MALSDFSNDLTVITVNGRQIKDWGDTATPYTDEPIDAPSALRRGLGGRSVRIDHGNPGRRVTVNLNPGSPDSAYMQGLFTSKANIELSYMQIGTLEAAIGVDGVMVNDASVGRAGTTISDDQYIIEFGSWTATKGGE